MKNKSTSKNKDQEAARQQFIAKKRTEIVLVAVELFSSLGYYLTTIERIAKAGGFSQGLVYRYFKDKEELLFCALSVVLNAYEMEIPPKLIGINHPVDKLCATISAFCTTVDNNRKATVLAYRSTKSLPVEKRAKIKESEENTNRFLISAVERCIEEEFMHKVDVHLMTYQYLTFAHSWALKEWAHEDKYKLDEYITGGLELLVKPFLTEKGLEYWETYFPIPEK